MHAGTAAEQQAGVNSKLKHGCGTAAPPVGEAPKLSVLAGEDHTAGSYILDASTLAVVMATYTRHASIRISTLQCSHCFSLKTHLFSCFPEEQDSSFVEEER